METNKGEKVVIKPVDPKQADLDELGMQTMDEAEAALAKRRAKIAAEETDLTNRERIAAVRAQQLIVDEREEGLKKTDKMITHHQESTKPKPGEAFIDEFGIHHLGSCNSHPSKRAHYKCDCGVNGTSRTR